MVPRKLELLAPARDINIAREAILHGADAVYIGAPDFGARKAASNSIEDIRRLVDFAHIFNVRVYVTVNTIIYENELLKVEKIITELYRAGVDALIIQDMGILRMDLPPIELHASTQCDIRTPEKAIFLQEAGFSQLVLARELTLNEIAEIAGSVSIPVETFVHGALCTCFSGRCQAGFAYNGRSGNRGECPQVCRLPFNLVDSTGKIIVRDKHLLSLKDFNASGALEELVSAGVSSFKIEGRLKEADYVKNVVAFYRRRLDTIIEASEGKLARSSAGESIIDFSPQLDKSFNRGFSQFMLKGSPKKGLGSFDTPKSLGERIHSPSQLNPGDGISYFDNSGNYTGMIVNGVSGSRIWGRNNEIVPKGVEIRRTSDMQWKKILSKPTAQRKLRLDFSLDSSGVTAKDETGAMVRLPWPVELQPAQKPMDWRKLFSKLGDTPFALGDLQNHIADKFAPASVIAAFRRNLIERLLSAKRSTYRYGYRRSENKEYPYPALNLDYRDNVANNLAEEFYREHGVKEIEKAAEMGKKEALTGRKVMTSRHCILRELGMCLKENGAKNKMPLYLESGKAKYQLKFDCENCEMSLIQK